MFQAIFNECSAVTTVHLPKSKKVKHNKIDASQQSAQQYLVCTLHTQPYNIHSDHYDKKKN